MLKVAVIDDNNEDVVSIKKILKNHSNWETKYFESGKDIIAENNVIEYDAIITDQKIRDIDGTELIKALRPRTKAYIALMSATPKTFAEYDVDDDAVSAYIYKNIWEGLEYIEEWLEKIESRIERKNKMDAADNDIKTMKGMANGYELTEISDYCILSFNRIISSVNRKILSETLNRFKYCIFNVHKENEVFTSFYVSQILNIHKEFKEKKIKFSIVGKGKDTVDLLKTCHLEMVMPIYGSLSEAIARTN